jgi:capsular exopolysaccharide synthesis family protein
MEVKDFFAPLLRWWHLILASVFIAGTFSLVAALQQPPVYRTKATLMIGRAIQDPNPEYYSFYSSQQLAATYADIAMRQIVQDGAMKTLGLTWLPAYTVSPVPNTELLEIVVQDTDPVRVQAVANELANQLILQSPTNQAESQSRQDFINQRLNTLEVKINETQAELDARQLELDNLTSARQISDLQNQISTLQNKLDTLNYNYTSLLSNTAQGAQNTLAIIEPANLPAAPVGPNRMMTVFTSIVAAFVLAAGAAYLLVYLDNTIKSPEEIKRLTNLSTLGAIPLIPGGNGSEKLITLREPRSPVAEAYRSLRTGVQFSTIDRPESTAIQITSSNPSEGKSITSANLAVVIAQAGLRVLLIDSDLRRPAVHKVFGTDNRRGFTDLLRSLRNQDFDETLDGLLKDLVRPTLVEGLSVLTSGPIPPNPSELLGSNTHRQLLQALRTHYDYIVMDSPPVLIVTDAMVLSTQVDGTILVIDAEATQRNQLKQAAERLKEVNANVLGVVVNRLHPKQDGFGAYSSYTQYRKYGEGSYGDPETGHSPIKGWKAPRIFKNRSKNTSK